MCWFVGSSVAASIKCWLVIVPALREWREEIFVAEALRKQYCLSIHLLLFICLGVSYIFLYQLFYLTSVRVYCF